jgi:nucleolar pre-ribosomal-associated protein 1
MAHIAEHPSRAKRRKLHDEQTSEDVNFTSPAQLRELLLFQQNASTAKQGECRPF